MDQSQEHKEDDLEHRSGDARTLVTALYHLLMDDSTPSAETVDRPRTALQRPANAYGDADAALQGITSNLSSNDDLPSIVTSRSQIETLFSGRE
jgi:hypothetical protein